MKGINDKDYVVLDVETNGTSSIRHDLLSLSIYKPDDGKMYNRFFPLELNNFVETTYINGITKKMLGSATPLTQDEVDTIINEFELDKRNILIYGNLDQRFIDKYFLRHKLKGNEKFKFYNFKHDIIAQKINLVTMSKDNLCILLDIDGVNEVHSGINDCILEWKLYKRLNGRKLLVKNEKMYYMNDDYYIPASYIAFHPNMKYHIKNFPNPSYKIESVKSFEIKSFLFKKFDTNINGIIIEKVINNKLGAIDKFDEYRNFIIENAKNLELAVSLPRPYHTIPISFDEQGFVVPQREEDKEFIDEVKGVQEKISDSIDEVINYLKEKVFKNETVYTQNLTLNKESKVLAFCDLSSDSTIVEIKAYKVDKERLEHIKYQLYYEADGRDIYVLHINWNKIKKGILEFNISKIIDTEVNKNIKTVVRNETIKSDLKNTYRCYLDSIARKSEGKIYVSNYKSINDTVDASCLVCGHNWKIKAEDLYKKTKCPKCRNK